MLYLISRFEPEYSIVYQILSEVNHILNPIFQTTSKKSTNSSLYKKIKKKDESYRPTNVFDFGSGLG